MLFRLAKECDRDPAVLGYLQPVPDSGRPAAPLAALGVDADDHRPPAASYVSALLCMLVLCAALPMDLVARMHALSSCALATAESPLECASMCRCSQLCSGQPICCLPRQVCLCGYLTAPLPTLQGMHPAAAALKSSWLAAAAGSPPSRRPPMQQPRAALPPPSARYAPSPTAALLKRHWSETEDQPKEMFARVSWGSGGTGTTPVKPRMVGGRPAFGARPSPLGGAMAPADFAAVAYSNGGFQEPMFSQPLASPQQPVPQQQPQQGLTMTQGMAGQALALGGPGATVAEQPTSALGSPVSGGSGGTRSGSGGRSLLQVREGPGSRKPGQVASLTSE